MLIVRLRNDGTGVRGCGNYDVEVLVTTSPTELETVWRGRVEGHDRAAGWPELLRLVALAGGAPERHRRRTPR